MVDLEGKHPNQEALNKYCMDICINMLKPVKIQDLSKKKCGSKEKTRSRTSNQKQSIKHVNKARSKKKTCGKHEK